MSILLKVNISAVWMVVNATTPEQQYLLGGDEDLKSYHIVLHSRERLLVSGNDF